MSREWEPGDHGITGGDDDQLRFIVQNDDGRLRFAYEDGLILGQPPRKDARRLAVVDPESPEDVARLLTAYYLEVAGAPQQEFAADNELVLGMQAALRRYADPTPRIEEPTGFAAVVIDADGVPWVRNNPRGDNKWSPESAAADGLNAPYRQWSAIKAVRIVFEGVPADA